MLECTNNRKDRCYFDVFSIQKSIIELFLIFIQNWCGFDADLIGIVDIKILPKVFILPISEKIQYIMTTK